MSYIDTGGDKPVLILIHGLGGTKEAWQSQMVLAKYYRLVIPDLRGHGESMITTNINLPNFAKDIKELMNRLGIKKAHFLGLSLGGAIVQQFMRDYPQMMLSAILANTVSYFPTYITCNTVTELDKALEIASDEEFIVNICNRGLVNKDLIPEALKGFKLRRETYIETARATVGANYLTTIAWFRKPLLLICSSDDVVTPYYNTLATYMFNSFASIEFLKDCGHLSYLDKKDEFNRIVTNFLGRL